MATRGQRPGGARRGRYAIGEGAEVVQALHHYVSSNPGSQLRVKAQMAHRCKHLNDIFDVTPSALGCEECLKTGDVWVHLRLCRTCGHVGCCDDPPNRHATKHFHATGHPIIEGYDPPEGWGWCYVDSDVRSIGPYDSTQRADPAFRVEKLLCGNSFVRFGSKADISRTMIA
jgi:hypothetical protein